MKFPFSIFNSKDALPFSLDKYWEDGSYFKHVAFKAMAYGVSGGTAYTESKDTANCRRIMQEVAGLINSDIEPAWKASNSQVSMTLNDAKIALAAHIINGTEIYCKNGMFNSMWDHLQQTYMVIAKWQKGPPITSEEAREKATAALQQIRQYVDEVRQEVRAEAEEPTPKQLHAAQVLLQRKQDAVSTSCII